MGTLKKVMEEKYLTLFPADESKDTLKKYEKLWNKIRDLIRSTSNNMDHYEKNIWKSNLIQMIIVVRSVFHEGNNCDPQTFFIGECLYKLKMLEYDKIDVSEGINVNKTNGCVII